MKLKRTVAFLTVFIMMLQSFVPLVSAVEEITELLETEEKAQAQEEKTEEKKEEKEGNTEEQENIFLQDTIAQENTEIETLSKEPINSLNINDEENINSTSDEEIQFKNEHFKKYFSNRYDYNSDGIITKSEMESINYLNISTYNFENYNNDEIVSLEDIKYCVNVEELYLYGNFTDLDYIKDLKKLINLGLSSLSNVKAIESMPNIKNLFLRNIDIAQIDFTKLQHLESLKLENCKIEDITPLKQLTNLKYLEISGYNNDQNTNLTIDATLIENMNNLTSLSLTNVRLEDISFLKDFINITELNLNSNEISDISVLENLVNLKKLELSSNNISDITVINKLKNLEELDVSYNDLMDLEKLENLENLEVSRLECAQNVKVENIQVPLGKTTEIDVPEILKKALDKNSKFYMDNLKLDIYYYSDSLISGNNSVKAYLNEEKTKIVIDATNSLNVGNMTIRMNFSLEEYNDDYPLYSSNIELKCKVYEEVTDKVKIDFEDSNFEIYMTEHYDFDGDEVITNFDMLQIDNLQISNLDSNIKSFKGIETAKNARRLSISHYYTNPDFSAIFEMPNIEDLYISGYKYSISGIEKMKKLKTLSLNQSTSDLDIDYSPIKTLDLESLNVYNNYSKVIFDLDFIANMNNLKYFRISGNIANEQVLNNLKQLTSLGITNSNLANIDFLANMTNLENLDLTKNRITNISALSGLNKLTSVTLQNNPIDLELPENANVYNTLISNGVYVYVSEYDKSEIIQIPDGELKACLLSNGIDINNDDEISKNEIEKVTSLSINSNYKIESLEGLQYATGLKKLSLSIDSYNNTADVSLEPISNLVNLEKIDLYGGLQEENTFDFLKGLINLKELKLYNIDKTIDMTELGNYTNITSLTLHGSRELENLEAIGKLINIKKLDISLYSEKNFDLSITNNLKQLEELNISGNVSNISSLWHNANLKRLTLPYNMMNSEIDCNGIQNLKQLEYLSISGDICKIQNFEEIAKIEKLNELVIYYSPTYYNGNNENKEREIQILDILEKMKCEKIILYISGYSVNLKGIECGTQKTIKIEDLNPILKACLNKDSKLYCENLTIRNYNENNNIIVDNKNKTITITSGTEVDNRSGNVQIEIKHGDSTYTTSMYLSWTDYKKADSEKEVNIPDPNLKKVLLENYDIDSDDKITETDMINILDLNIYNKEIRSLEGIEKAINLRTISAGNNEITDIKPIIGLEKLEYIEFHNNFISDISCLKNAKFLNNIQYEDSISLGNNFIDFTKGNENYNVLKQIYSNISGIEQETGIFKQTTRNQKNGKIDEIDKIVDLEANLKKKLIEIGIDTNKDGNLTRRELYMAYKIEKTQQTGIFDLSNSNITDISGIEYLNVYTINLANNNISNILPITKNNVIYCVDLSNNNISDLSGIENSAQLEIINLSNNNIKDITPISKLYSMTASYEYGFGYTDIDLSHNKIDDISCIVEWKNIGVLNLSHNKISDISSLKNYKYIEESYEGQRNIDLSYNYINMNNQSNIEAKNLFEKYKNPLILDNQESLSDISGFVVSQKYNSNNNTVTVTITSKSELEDTKPTWNLSKDKYTYNKEYTENGTFGTTVLDINGYSENVSFTITAIDEKGPEVKIEKIYDAKTNTVTVFAVSNEKLGETKPTWILSENKLTYSKIHNLNGTYTTTFCDIFGNTTEVNFNITEIKSGYTVLQTYDVKTNRVLVNVNSKCEFKETKPTWELSEDKLNYSKIYEENGTYTTTFTDINGKTENIIFIINAIDQEGPEIIIEKKYDEKTNTVTVNAISNEILGQTKPTWKLSEDQLTYSKVYEENGTYTTTFSDVYGNTAKAEFEVTEVQSGYEVFQKYDSKSNNVTIEVKSKCKLQNTKPTWKLSEDQYTYSKVYTENGTYTTAFTDTNNTTENVTFKIREIDDKAPEITIQKVYNESTNTVTVNAVSNEVLGQTKPTWKLSEDKLVYSKEYTTNASYETSFSDVYGNTAKVKFEVTEVKSGYEVFQSYDNKLNIVTINVKSKCELQNTKPTWNLSEDRLTYSKEYRNNGVYTTSFMDINGNSENVTFEITLIDEKGPEIKIEKKYDEETNTVLVNAISSEILGQTKPSWDLSENKLVYSKRYDVNGTYSTVFRDTYGNASNVTFDVEEVQSGFTVSKVYDSKTNTVTISVSSRCELQDTKPTWKLSENRYLYSKIYEENGTYTTAFTDVNGNVENIKFDITEIDNDGPEIIIESKYDEETNTVTVNAISNEILGQTKPTWKLSEDKLIYSKTYATNGTYSTTFSDIYGNSSKVTFEVKEIVPEFTITQVYNENENTVTVIAKAKNGFEATKPTWNLSEDKMTYTKIYSLNGTYSTEFVDSNGNTQTLIFEVSKIK